MSDILKFHEVDNSGAAALEERGVCWPMGGFSPGRHTMLCEKCCRRHLAADRSVSCLPCAVANAVDVGLRACASQTRSFHRGRQSGIDDMRRFLANGAKDWGRPPVPMTPAQKADVKAQRDAAEGSAEIDILIATTRAAQARMEAERRAAELADTDPDGDAA